MHPGREAQGGALVITLESVRSPVSPVFTTSFLPAAFGLSAGGALLITGQAFVASEVAALPETNPEVEALAASAAVRQALLTAYSTYAATAPSAWVRSLTEVPSNEPSYLDLRA
jgi:hypothetical protein